MSERLRELLRQRALMQEHMSWLDREIAALSASTNEAASKLPTEKPTSVTPTPLDLSASPAVAIAAKVISASTAAAPAPPSLPAADAILDEYRVPPNRLQSDVRRGCLLYFAVGLGLVALLVATLYFTIGRH